MYDISKRARAQAESIPSPANDSRTVLFAGLEMSLCFFSRATGIASVPLSFSFFFVLLLLLLLLLLRCMRALRGPRLVIARGEQRSVARFGCDVSVGYVTATARPPPPPLLSCYAATAALQPKKTRVSAVMLLA